MWWIALVAIGIVAFFVMLNKNAAADEAKLQKRRWSKIANGDYEFVLIEHRQRMKRRQEELAQATKALEEAHNNHELPHLDFDHPTAELEEIARLHPHDKTVTELIFEIKSTNSARDKVNEAVKGL